MDYDKLKDYFYRYIKQYIPYSDDDFHQVLINFLQDSYLKNTYVDIPSQFKTLFEEHLLEPELYNVILISLGYPKDLVESISDAHKEILLMNFTDYHSNKSTLGFFQDVCSNFLDYINLYELYLHHNVNDITDWKLIPKIVYENSSTILQEINYEEVYNAIPTTLLSTQLLNGYYDAGLFKNYGIIYFIFMRQKYQFKMKFKIL